MDLPHIAALSVFGGYFVAILGLFSLIISSLYSSKRCARVRGSTLAVFCGLTLASFAHTWLYMFKYMAWSFSDYGRALPASSSPLISRIAGWVHDTSLFEQAWALVCSKPLNWWWSEQLCLFTAGTWTVFIATEGKRHQVKHVWAYMLLGQIVAISVASNLFYIAILLSAPSTPRNERLSRSASPRIWLSVLLSLVTVALSPFTSRQTFLLNLLAMHALLFVPLMSTSASVAEEKTSNYSMNLSTLYRLVHIASVAIHARTIYVAVDSLDLTTPQVSLRMVSAVWETLYSNPAQSSIGWDVIWTSISFVAFIIARPVQSGASDSGLPDTDLSKSLPYLLLATPIASLGVTAPYVLQPREGPLPVGPTIEKSE